MVQQLSIYDQIEKKKREGIELVYQHANSEWKRAAAEQLLNVASRKRLFTSDDIIIPLENRGVVTGDNRAIAAVLLSAKRMGLIAATETQVRCRRKSRHHGWVMQWQSQMKIST